MTLNIGNLIGKTGQTGNAKDQAAKMAHLHFEIRTKGTKVGNKVKTTTTILELKNSIDTNPNKTNQK